MERATHHRSCLCSREPEPWSLSAALSKSGRGKAVDLWATTHVHMLERSAGLQEVLPIWGDNSNLKKPYSYTLWFSLDDDLNKHI